MAENLAGLLCYAGGWITGLIFLQTDKRPFVRFHAAQSILVFAPLNILYAILILIVPDGPPLYALRLLMALPWIFLMYKAYQGERFRLPLMAEIAGALPPPLTEPFAELAGKGSTGSFGALTGGASAGPSLGPPVASFDRTKGAVTVQMVKQIGRWTDADATRALGNPTKQEMLGSGDGAGQQLNTYVYIDAAGQMHEFSMIFNDKSKILECVSVTPRDVSLDEMKLSLGEDSMRTEMPSGWRQYYYNNLKVGLIVDGSDKVKVMLFAVGVDEAALFAKPGRWPTCLP